MPKQKYYSLKKIDSTGTKYRMIVSERSSGKSYAVKLKVLKYCWETKRKFAYIRRSTDERTANAVNEYFENMEVNKDGKREIYNFTKGECDCIDVYAERIFLCKTQEDGTKKKILMVGHAFALVKEGRYKSHAYEDYDYAIFEEFITDMGYIPREMKHFENLISTIFRKRKAVVYMIGNTLTPVCPYFNEWRIDILKIKQGTIEVYNYHTNKYDENGEEIIITIAYEYPNPVGESGQMFFANDSMISEGKWDVDSYPIIDEAELTKYVEWYTIMFEYTQFRFKVTIMTGKYDYRNPFLFITSLDNDDEIPNDVRTVSSNYSPSRLWTVKFSQCLNKYDSLICELLDKEKTVFLDNFTGTNFYQCISDMGAY